MRHSNPNNDTATHISNMEKHLRSCLCRHGKKVFFCSVWEVFWHQNFIYTAKPTSVCAVVLTISLQSFEKFRE